METHDFQTVLVLVMFGISKILAHVTRNILPRCFLEYFSTDPCIFSDFFKNITKPIDDFGFLIILGVFQFQLKPRLLENRPFAL